MNFDLLLAELYWIEYCEVVEEAQDAYCEGDNLRALALAIMAHKTRSKYEDAISRIIFNG